MKISIPELIEALKQRQKGLEDELIKYVREAPASNSSEDLMCRVRYDTGRINELVDIITFIEQRVE